MIIFDGDYDRIYRQMLDEDAKVKYYIDKLQGGIVKKFRQQRTFPIWHYEQITLPKSNNTYLIYYYVKDAVEANRMFNHFWGALLLLNTNNGNRLILSLREVTLRELKIDTLKLKDHETHELQVYSGHFFSRYRERMNLPSEWSVNDVIANFFGRNGYYFTQLNYNSIVLEKNRNKGNAAFAIEEGVTLGDETITNDYHLVKHNTFLSLAELKMDQDKATPGVTIMRDVVSHKKTAH